MILQKKIMAAGLLDRERGVDLPPNVWVEATPEFFKYYGGEQQFITPDYNYNGKKLLFNMSKWDPNDNLMFPKKKVLEVPPPAATVVAKKVAVETVVEVEVAEVTAPTDKVESKVEAPTKKRGRPRKVQIG